MDFTVTYWQPARYTAVAGHGEVVLALAAYIGQEPGDEDAGRAAKALLALAGGREPGDLDIVATALREHGFEAPKGTEPDGFDVATDYAVTTRPGTTPAGEAEGLTR